MATKLQKHEMKAVLNKYGSIHVERDSSNWFKVTVVPYGRPYVGIYYGASRKVEYLAMRQIKQHLYHSILSQVQQIDEGS